jgi:hypothetical protein
VRGVLGLWSSVFGHRSAHDPRCRDTETARQPAAKCGPDNLSRAGSDKPTRAIETATLQLTIRKQLAKVNS